MSDQEVLKVIDAFQTAWLTLLANERLQAENISRLPGLLMGAVLETARSREGEVEDWATIALRRLELYEFELERSEHILN